MTTTTLGIAVTSNAATAAADLDKLVVASDKAEKGAKRVGTSSREMGAALQSITTILASIERNTLAMASGLGKSATATMALNSASMTTAASMRAFDTVSAKVSMDMTGLKTGVVAATAAIEQEATAVNRASNAIDSNSAALARNRVARATSVGAPIARPGNFQTSNIAAQFQDIAVTSQMGMSPMSIALQQGAQLSAALGNNGLRGTVTALGAAFASVISPVSLLTIAAVGLGAAGIQAIAGMMNSTESATKSLEDYRTELGGILTGWDEAGAAAKAALDLAAKMPKGVVQADLLASLVDQEKAAQELDDKIKNTRQTLSDTANYIKDLQASALAGMGGVSDSQLQQIEFLRDLGISSSTARPELEAAMTAARELFHTAEDPAIKDMANAVYTLAQQLYIAQGAANATAASLATLNNQALLTNVSAGADTAIAAIIRLKALAPDLRDGYRKAADELNNALGASPDGILRQAAQQQYGATVAALDAQKRQQEALKAGRIGAAAGAKSGNQWETAQDNFQQRLEATRLDIQLMGKSTYEVDRQKAAFDLLNQAKQAGIPITSTVTDQINAMAEESATATAKLDRMTQAANDNTAIWSQAQDGVSGVIKTWVHGGNVLDAIGDKLGSIADMLIDMTVRDLFGAALSGGTTGGGGGNILGFLGSLIGLPGHAMGTANTGGSRGQPAGIVHGQEAVIPLPNGGKVPVEIEGAPQRVHVTFGIAADQNGNILPFIQSVVQQGIGNAAPAIVGASVTQASKAAPASLARYQRQQGGSDYRVG